MKALATLSHFNNITGGNLFGEGGYAGGVSSFVTWLTNWNLPKVFFGKFVYGLINYFLLTFSWKFEDDVAFLIIIIFLSSKIFLLKLNFPAEMSTFW